MKNTGKKILVLVVFIICAIAGIMVFYRTKVSPRIEFRFENRHLQDIDFDISKFSDKKSYSYNDSLYSTVKDKVNLYHKEDYIDIAETDQKLQSFVQKYVPVYVELCYKKFNASVWKESDHELMRSRIKELKSLTLSNGSTKVVAGSFLNDLGNIEGIIDSYYAAKKVSAYSSFSSVSDAKSKINKAENYKTTAYLKNCTDLVNKLSKVKVNIGNSHYSHVESQVYQLTNYRNMTKESFLELERTVLSKIKEYDENKSMYGSSAKDITPVRKRASEIHKEAMAFYEKPEITINTNSQWISMTSPSTSYRAYQSSSNRHIANSNAKMYFTIKGYSSFSFKIRSNGEGNYDYVMVGLNREPTTENNYSNTKGNPSSGTYTYNYKDVTLTGLDKSSSYTIYVVYRKDSSNDYGDDRGYVLIPYANN